MEEIKLKYYKVRSLPSITKPNSVYYVKDQNEDSVTSYITGKDCIPYPLVDATSFSAATEWSANHSTETGNPYTIGTHVFWNGHIYRCKYNNDGIPTTDSTYWLDLGVGYLLAEEQSDFDATTGRAFIKNKPTKTSDFINDGEDGTNPFITLEDIPVFDSSDYDLDDFTNNNADPFAKISDLPAYSDFIQNSITNGVVNKAPTENAVYDALQLKQDIIGYTPVNKAGDTMLGNLTLKEDPTTALQAATKQYVDTIALGINFHAPVRVATTGNIEANYSNGVGGVGASLTGVVLTSDPLEIDSTTLEQGDRVLVWQQTESFQNGIYEVTDAGNALDPFILTRTSDADNSPVGEIVSGDYVLSVEGYTYVGYGFICNTPGTIIIGTTGINFVQFNAAQAVTPGYGLREVVSNVISINPDETQEKITLTTTGTGPATLISNILNIPETSTGDVSATESGIVNNTSLQELGGVDKTINGIRIGRGNISGTASENTAVGYQALQSVTHNSGYEGYYNTAFGEEALKSLTTGYSNDAFGDWALKFCTTGTFNTAIGGSTLESLIDGTQNLAIGTNSLRYNISGQKNTAVGVGALYRNTGSFNTAIGNLAGGQSTSSGSNNILIGFQAGRDISTGTNNLLIENITNASITSGSFNIVLNPKQKSGVTTGSYNTIIGAFDGTFATGMANNVILADGQGNIRFRTTETGLTTVPGQTNSIITADTTGKAIITKEYFVANSGVGGTTNLSYTTAPTNGIVTSDTGTDATIPLADATNAGLLKPAKFTVLENTTGSNSGDETTTTIKTKLGITTLSGDNTGDQSVNTLTNVSISSLFNGDVLQYESATQLWKNKSLLVGDSDFGNDNNTYNSTLLVASFSALSTDINNRISKGASGAYTTNTIRTVSAAEYAAIGTKDPNTLYFII